ncbi:MAG: bleomycin resistance family protein [Bacteroidota bacterium]|nr:bleomycin resistance family protein [Bacteroidota bacterium]MDP4193221.1 bleomycin resistance family protein [Bacteroidota bacterium]
MRFFKLSVILLLLASFSGCIKHSESPLRRKFKGNPEEIAKLRRVTPNLMVENVNQTIDFYEKTFGFEPIVTIPDTGKFSRAILAFGRVEIMLQSRESFSEEFGIYNNPPAGGTVSLFFQVSNIVPLYDKVSVKTTIVRELHQTFLGTKEFSAKDNNGYILTFSEALKK